MYKEKHESEFTNNPSYSLDFEYTMMLLFGSKADQIASFAANKKYLKKWLMRAIKKLIRDTNSLETTERHKEMLIMKLQSINKILKEGGNLWEMIFDFFNLTARFLGYDYHRVQRLITPTYFQTPSQNFWNGLYKGEDWKKQDEKRKIFISKRIEIIMQLKKARYSDFEISQIFNTSEYYIKKLLLELKSLK